MRNAVLITRGRIGAHQIGGMRQREGRSIQHENRAVRQDRIARQPAAQLFDHAVKDFDSYQRGQLLPRPAIGAGSRRDLVGGRSVALPLALQELLDGLGEGALGQQPL